MDNRIEIDYQPGGYAWRVLTVDGTLLGQGFAASRRDAARQAIEWMER